MKKIIQISSAFSDSYGDSIHALTEDGKVYFWGQKQQLTPIENVTPLTVSTGTYQKKFGWIELVDELN